MSLFIGGLSHDVRTNDLHDLLSPFGKMLRCDVKKSYGFIIFEDERDAEDAVEKLNGSSVKGQKINVEWAKGSGRYDPNTDRSDYHNPAARSDLGPKCYSCGERGHFAKNCSSSRGRDRRDRSRSPRDRRDRNRSRSPRDRRDRDRRDRSRDRDSRRDRDRRDRSRDRDNRKDRDGDRKDRDRSRERNKDKNDRDRSKSRERNGDKENGKSNGNKENGKDHKNEDAKKEGSQSPKSPKSPQSPKSAGSPKSPMDE